MSKLIEFIKIYSWLFYVLGLIMLSYFAVYLIVVKILIPMIVYPIIHLFSFFGDKLL